MGRQIEAQLRRMKFVPPKVHEFSSNQALFAMVATSGQRTPRRRWWAQSDDAEVKTMAPSDVPMASLITWSGG